ALGKLIITDRKKLAILAIDPSSRRSKGSIMGDKTRMEALTANPDVYIRPSPSGTSLGGVARKTREASVLCEAAGYNIICIETVGVGQSETAVHSMTDLFLLLMLPGAGDELQGIKRGITEMADIIAVNKADGRLMQKAELAKRDLENALQLFPPEESGWKPRVLTCSSLNNQGITELWENMNEYFRFVTDNGYLIKRRSQQALYWMKEAIRNNLHDHFYNSPTVQKQIRQAEKDVANGKVNPFTAANRLLESYLSRRKKIR
ncbi:MAG: methylmalonyl Co-A mutase-associated GTPase MeaB, partial [Bacteroidetes bacterium]|nr:methylmalonyl Co-A mutase-associated GTPase MeaB [Bacteroidota bacterium]